jgi:FHIPEP family
VTASAGEATVQITLAPGETEHTDDVRERAEATLATIVEGLDLPITTPTVSVTPGDRLEVVINGVACQPPPSRFIVRHSSSPADRVAYALQAQARLLVRADMATTMWSTVSGSAEPGAPPWFLGLVRDLVHHRVRPARLASLPGLGADAEPHALFEAALTAAGRPCRITVDERTARTFTESPADIRGFMTFLATGLSEELGMPIAVPRLDIDPALPDHHFTVEVGDLAAPPMPGIESDQILVNDTAERLMLLALPEMSATTVTNPATGQPAALVPAALTAQLEAIGLTTWTMAGYIVLSAAEIIRRHAAALYRLEFLRYQLGRLAIDHPMLEPMIEGIGGIEVVLRVLRRLVGEGVSVRTLPKIISALYRAAPPPPAVPGRMSIATRLHRMEVVDSPDVGDLREASLAATARVAASPDIVHKYTRGSSTLVVYLLDVQVENRLHDSTELTAAERRGLVDMMANELALLPRTAQIPVVLTRSALRARFRSVIAVEQPTVAVLAYEELSGALNVQPIARLIP